MKLAPEWVRTSDPVNRSPARYRWTTAPALASVRSWQANVNGSRVLRKITNAKIYEDKREFVL